jgi:hypothetical protein
MMIAMIGPAEGLEFGISLLLILAARGRGEAADYMEQGSPGK